MDRTRRPVSRSLLNVLAGFPASRQSFLPKLAPLGGERKVHLNVMTSSSLWGRYEVRQEVNLSTSISCPAANSKRDGLTRADAGAAEQSRVNVNHRFPLKESLPDGVKPSDLSVDSTHKRTVHTRAPHVHTHVYVPLAKHNHGILPSINKWSGRSGRRRRWGRKGGD